MARAKLHHWDKETDQCVCGGQIVWFADLPGYPEGCEVAGEGWPYDAASPREKRRLDELEGLARQWKR